MPSTIFPSLIIEGCETILQCSIEVWDIYWFTGVMKETDRKETASKMTRTESKVSKKPVQRTNEWHYSTTQIEEGDILLAAPLAERLTGTSYGSGDLSGLNLGGVLSFVNSIRVATLFSGHSELFGMPSGSVLHPDNIWKAWIVSLTFTKPKDHLFDGQQLP